MIQATLQEIYGTDAEAQRHRYADALEEFRARYGPGDIRTFRAPGRVNLIGEHTDYNHGYVMPVALDKDILLLARPRADAVVQVQNLEEEFPPFSFSLSTDIPPGPPGDWGNYIRAAGQAVARQLSGQPLHGLDGLVVGAPPHGLPRQVGLSSSSATVVVAALTLAHINEWSPDEMAFAQFCAEAEWYVGTRGGIMDQFIAVLGQRDHALFLDCRPDTVGRYTMQNVPLLSGYHVLIADSGVRHQNVKGGYNQRVAACRAGVELLRSNFSRITHLRDVQMVPCAELEEHLPESITLAELKAQDIDLGDVPGLTDDVALKVRARCRHVWTENQRVLDAITALRNQDATSLGDLLNAAHASARDDYEISCTELDALVNAAREVEGVVGARLTGAGWGGCIVAVVQEDAVSEFETHVSQRYKDLTRLDTSIFACRAGPGARECILE